MRMTCGLGVFLFLLLLLVTAPLGPALAGEDESPFPLSPTEWLVIQPVDFRARRPFNPDAVFERYLLGRHAPPPKAGDTLQGERGKAGAWKAVQADEKGRIHGPLAYAYTRVEVQRPCIALARLDRGATLFVDGTPVVGDIYGSGYGGLPVALRKGAHDIFVRGVRGSFKLTFETPPAPVFAASWSRTLPDLTTGRGIDAPAGIFVVNATRKALSGVQVRLGGNEWLAPAKLETPVSIAPLSLLQVRLPLRMRPGATAPDEAGPFEIPLSIRGEQGEVLQTTTLALHVRTPADALIRTFVSDIDGSVQKFGLRAPLPGAGKKASMGLVLSLHGASVPPHSQTRAYSSKPDFWIAAATNRRPFGFDWQDWGRLDAYEVLAEALRISGVDRRRVYLTGHSMGGHGTWHLGANDPDGFAAIAPSAGWISFDTYPGPRRAGTHTGIWHRADGPSLTRSLLDNLAQLPTFILHGTKDDNVPIEQARQMEAHLIHAGRKPKVHYEEGAGHWWNGKAAKGTDCVDWPGIFGLFRAHTIAERPERIEFTTWNPAVDSTHHWVTVWQQERYGKPSRVQAQWDPEARRVSVQTENVACLAIEAPGDVHTFVLDGDLVNATGQDPSWFARQGGSAWFLMSGRIPASEKSPDAGGPLRQAWRRNFVLVYGTIGTLQENHALLAQARHDAQTWYYRGNGRAEMISDLHFRRNPGRYGRRNVILYGNRNTNAGFATLDPDIPIRVHRSMIRVRDHIYVGRDLCACFVYRQSWPRPGRLVGIMGSTGVEGARLGPTLMTFVSGAGYPDYVIFDSGILEKGDDAVLDAGWFDRAWHLPPKKGK